MLILPFERSFEGREDPYLIDTLKEELGGIAAWAVEGARLVENSERGLQFPVPSRAEDAIRMYHLQNNPFDHFLEERFVKKEEGFIATEMLWYQWKNWLKVNGVKGIHVARNQIAMKIETQSSWDVYRCRPNAESKRGLKGMSLRRIFEDLD